MVGTLEWIKYTVVCNVFFKQATTIVLGVLPLCAIFWRHNCLWSFRLPQFNILMKYNGKVVQLSYNFPGIYNIFKKVKIRVSMYWNTTVLYSFSFYYSDKLTLYKYVYINCLLRLSFTTVIPLFNNILLIEIS